MKLLRWQSILLAVALLALTGLAAGCVVAAVGAAAAAGAGGYAYVEGDLKYTASASFDRAWTASLAALKDLEFGPVTQKRDASGGELLTTTASNKKVSVKLKKLSAAATEIHIRVGTFGDETVSQLILEKIKKRL